MRSNELELLDLGPTHYTPQEYDDCLTELGRVGSLLGGDAATFRAFDKFTPPSTILDVGCGGGIFTIQLAKKYPKSRVVGIDIAKEAIDYAQKKLSLSCVKNVEFKLTVNPKLDFAPDSFDAITCTLVCHHLNDQELVEFLRSSFRIAKKFIVINDLHRHKLSSLIFSLISKPLFKNRLITHDGLISIRRSFKKKEWVDYLKKAGIPMDRCKIEWHPFFRWIVSIDARKQ
jgi:2-polyprenyl-3-methyl-5-hydroxy-6-metoxy-1,4-benzoquinol methylase